MNIETGSQSILLRPRPYAQFSGTLLLLPLLPHRKPVKPLPSEIWTAIFAYALQHDGEEPSLAAPLLRVCKAFKEVALPLVYSHIRIRQTTTLEKFQKRLHSADQKWDSIRRIPYSTPGRWVQTLDLSNMTFVGQAQALQVDSLLTRIFPLVPFLTHFSMNPSFLLSRRAMSSLAEREGTTHICTLEGLSYVSPRFSAPGDDPLVKLLRSCINLEELEVIGQDPDPAELDFTFQDAEAAPPESFAPLDLSKLNTISLLSMYTSPLMTVLLYSPLPNLRKLTLTPYNDIPFPASLVSQLINVCGKTLRSLLLYTPKSWPTRLHPSPTTLLDTCPRLRHLSLEAPLPHIICTGTHPLQILSIPRPNAEFWGIFERILPQLPELYVLRTRDVRWLRKGMNSRAQEAGVQGEMREWRKRLARRGIRLLDADWNENE
ncbi:hypothetical protein BDZ94DRAFT_1151715 [Collybia nuda]|uniref:F-box domain-containing protein n=1 Tax=Collybia nuda TaxID=64659 RepID=A0A9P6CRJ6_9AGAR|nr:hypothetical protein BDZ94DRAFT_1151715 [Collybia nuda]